MYEGLIPGDGAHADLLPIGGTTIKVNAKCGIIKHCCSGYFCYSCKLDFDIDGDSFKDPWDYFSIIPGEFETGEPYDIHAKWTDNILGCHKEKTIHNYSEVDQYIGNGYW